MLLRLVLLFALLPVLELVLLIYIYSHIGLIWTLVWIVGTAFGGAALAKLQGLRTWRRLQQEVALGRSPGGTLLDGFLILLAGLMLIMPGLITDLLGLLLLFPPTRAHIRRRIDRALRGGMAGSGAGGGGFGAGGPVVIDTEFAARDDRDVPDWWP